MFLDGWTHTANTSQFVCPVTGIYLVEYDLLAASNNDTDATISFRAVTGVASPGNEIIGSQKALSVVTNGVVRPLSNSFLVNLTSGLTMRFQRNGTNNGGRILPAGTGVVRPSISTTITRIT